MLWARRNRLDVDSFVTITDGETWAGQEGHPSQALDAYRQATGIPARHAVVGMTATDVSIADPQDAGQLDVAGFDLATPDLISGFARGEV